ncbi:MAG: YibE/F family protein, partial [Planctomycetota bacterium]
MGEPAPTPEDRLLPSARFLSVWTAVVVALTVAAWLLVPRLAWYRRAATGRVERGVVTDVEQRGTMDRLTVRCPSGERRLEVEQPSGLFAPQAVAEGERVLVRVDERDGVSLGPKVRDRTLLVVTAVFFLILGVAGGPRALRTALSLVAAFALLAVVLVPAAVAGWDPLAVGGGLAVVIAGGTVFVVGGLNRKALAAFLGTLGGLALALAVGSAAVWRLALTGLSIDFGLYKETGLTYWRSAAVGHIDFAHLLVAGVVLSCLGAAMDVAISVATAVREVVTNRPDLSRREALRAGLSVGRAAVWMTAATFFFVLVGANLEPFLARSLQAEPSEWVRLLGFEGLAVEVVRLAAAGLAMAAVAPLTAAFAALLLVRRRHSPAQPTSVRSQSQIPNRKPQIPLPWRLALCLSFAVFLGLGLVLLDRLALRSIPSPATEPDPAGFTAQQALGRVLALQPPAVDPGGGSPRTRGRPYRWQLIACQVLTGAHAGRTVLVNQMVHPSPVYNLVVHEGDRVALELASRGEVITSAILRKPPLRHRALLVLAGALFGGLLVFGGWRSARNTLGVVAIVALLLGGLFPLLERGLSPLLGMAGFSTL